MATKETKEFVVKYKDDAKTKQAVFDMLIAWYLKHKAFSGESIMQMDEPQIDAPEFLSDVAERIGFDVEYKE